MAKAPKFEGSKADMREDKAGQKKLDKRAAMKAKQKKAKGRGR